MWPSEDIILVNEECDWVKTLFLLAITWILFTQFENNIFLTNEYADSDYKLMQVRCIKKIFSLTNEWILYFKTFLYGYFENEYESQITENL